MADALEAMRTGEHVGSATGRWVPHSGLPAGHRAALLVQPMRLRGGFYEPPEALAMWKTYPCHNCRRAPELPGGPHGRPRFTGGCADRPRGLAR